MEKDAIICPNCGAEIEYGVTCQYGCRASLYGIALSGNSYVDIIFDKTE